MRKEKKRRPKRQPKRQPKQQLDCYGVDFCGKGKIDTIIMQGLGELGKI